MLGGDVEGGEDVRVGGDGDEEEGHVVEAGYREGVGDLHQLLVGVGVAEDAVEDPEEVEEEEDQRLEGQGAVADGQLLEREGGVGGELGGGEGREE